MKLLTKELLKRLPSLYETDDSEKEAIVRAKFFHPFSNMTWYAIEYDPSDGTFFGYVANGRLSELGYFTLAELESVNIKGLKMERDLGFQECPLSEVME